jgi:hypothetical protein
MTDKAITQNGIDRIIESWQGLTNYQEIIDLASEQLEAKEYLRVSILLDEYRSMAEYFLDELRAGIGAIESLNPETLSPDTSDAVAKCARIGVDHKPVHSSTPTLDKA